MFYAMAFVFGVLIGVLYVRVQANWPFLKCRLHARYVHGIKDMEKAEFTMCRHKVTGKLVNIQCDTCGQIIYSDNRLFADKEDSSD